MKPQKVTMIQEAKVSLANAKKASVDAAVAAVLAEVAFHD